MSNLIKLISFVGPNSLLSRLRISRDASEHSTICCPTPLQLSQARFPMDGTACAPANVSSSSPSSPSLLSNFPVKKQDGVFIILSKPPLVIKQNKDGDRIRV